MYHNSVSYSGIPASGNSSFVMGCIKELLVADVIIPAMLIVGVLIICWAIRLSIEVKEDNDEQ